MDRTFSVDITGRFVHERIQKIISFIGRKEFHVLQTTTNQYIVMWKCSEAAAEQIRLSDGAGQALCDDRAK